MEINNDTRYFQKEENYIECYLDNNLFRYIRPQILTPTNYNHFNIETKLLNDKEIEFLSNELGFDVCTSKIISLWS